METQHLEISKLHPWQEYFLAKLLLDLEHGDSNFLQHFVAALILTQMGYVDQSDYDFKVLAYGEKKTFIQLIEEALWLNQ